MIDHTDGTRPIDKIDAAARKTNASDPEILPILAHPSQILNDQALSLEQKRATLASWLSDSNAVSDAPRWRKLDNGAFVDIHDIWDALRALDDVEGINRGGGRSAFPSPFRRRKRKAPFRGLTRRRRNDDDDGPPPSPAAIHLPALRPSQWCMRLPASLSMSA